MLSTPTCIVKIDNEMKITRTCVIFVLGSDDYELFLQRGFTIFLLLSAVDFYHCHCCYLGLCEIACLIHNLSVVEMTTDAEEVLGCCDTFN